MLVAVALLAALFTSGARDAGAAANLQPFKRVDLPADAQSLGVDPTNGFIYTYRPSTHRVNAYTPNGLYASTSSIDLQGPPSVILDGTSVFVVDRLAGQVTQLNRFSLATLRTYATPLHQPDSGVRVGNALWLRDTSTLSIFKVDLGSGALTNYTTWGPADLTAVTGTTRVIANVASLTTTTYVLDVAIDPPTVLTTKTFPTAMAFYPDPAGAQVFGMDVGTVNAAPLQSFAIPALTPTGEAYQPPAGAFRGINVAPAVTTLAGGWLAVASGTPPTMSVYHRGAGSVVASYDVASSVPVAWRSADATLLAQRGSALEFFAVAAPTAPTGPTGEYTPVTPYRVFDSRFGTADNPRATALGPGEAVGVQVTGVGPVPPTGVDAVVVNVTVLGATAPTFVTVYPAGAALPPVSNVNVSPGQLKVNAAFVRVGDAGQVSLYNDQGTTSVVIDIQGYISSPDGPSGSRFHALAPRRLLDTRDNASPVAPGSTTILAVTGRGVPANATAVMLNVTIVGPSASDYVVVYPTGAAEPFASNVNADTDQTVPNLVVAKVGAGGQVNLGNVGASAHLVVDITGWWDNDRSTNAGRYIPELQPMRWIDSRPVIGTVDAAAYLAVTFGNYPIEAPHLLASAGGTGTLVVNTTVLAIDGGGYAQVYAGELEGNAPFVSNLNFAAGETVANLTAPQLGSDNRVIFNAEGSTTHVIMDLQGYFTNEHY